jgi:hypothetical protein
MRMTRNRLARRWLGSWTAFPSLILLGACGDGGDAAPDDLVSWQIDVGSFSDSGFGARIRLNGEDVYSDVGTTLSRHEVEIVRPYVGGENIVEVEIIAADVSPVEYVASCTAEVTPAGQVIHADGVPTSLGVGGRLFLRISL